jgi:hypothetical protein
MFKAMLLLVSYHKTVSIPCLLLKELYEYFDRIEEILATLEDLSDKKGQNRIEKSLEEYKKRNLSPSQALRKSEKPY